MSTAPKPALRLATDSSSQLPPPGPRWVFVIQMSGTNNLLVETARRENNQLRVKLPQVKRTEPEFEEDLIQMLANPPFNSLRLQAFVLRQMSDPLIVNLPHHAQEHKRATTQEILGGLELIYVHVELTAVPFTGNDFLRLMPASALLDNCQSYRREDYAQVLSWFGLL